MMFGAIWGALIGNVSRYRKAIISNNPSMLPAGFTDTIIAREENLREECGSQYIFSTAFHFPSKQTS